MEFYYCGDEECSRKVKEDWEKRRHHPIFISDAMMEYFFPKTGQIVKIGNPGEKKP